MLKLEGQRYGRLIVMRRALGGTWLCQCDCGVVAYVTTSNLRGGNSRSCGCARDEARRTHGQTGSPEYISWKAMRSRCNRKTDIAYRHYGDRGITVCPEWSDFVRFLSDMGPKPSKRHDLDRIDNDKGYFKENCRWVSRQVNLSNRRVNRFVEFNGRRQTITDWARELGIPSRTLFNRIDRGWPVERALVKPKTLE